ncbi:chromosome partitioning protein [Cohaesibacter sp. ES.047]|uniref:ParA family protein n=1 Tax=Cohaesibacter sp. ES.047 TaxID=1798205 RepID=UPI000BB78717|nr:AAA family ATPase [Cohaesibacter sp. ES.047]SNY91266.1 chromosome partitioning protein [Cohaesibacter sp. ES.047]
MKIIACYSNKGGVGKTAVSVNLSYAMAEAGKRVLLCDLDPQGASSFYYRVKPSRKLTDEKFFKDVERFTSAIRGSDFDNLDILPANMTFRNFDVFLSRMRNSRSRLKKALKSVKADYDIIVLDCPPNISALSESVFKSADYIVAPVIPTTLSQRTFEQLLDFFKKHDIPRKKLLAFFSMVQSVKTLHQGLIDEMSDQYGKHFLEARIPFASDIEKMGVHRAPVLVTASSSAASKAYRALYRELSERISL